jgi:ribosome-associated protein
MPAPDPSDTALRVDAGHAIPRDELEVRATRSGGPGGQHVNVTSTRVEVRWNVPTTRALTPEERERVGARLASRLDGEGWLRVAASDTRSQRQNRQLAEHRLASLVAGALKVPKARKKTRTPRSATERRLQEKKLRGSRKRDRRKEGWD